MENDDGYYDFDFSNDSFLSMTYATDWPDDDLHSGWCDADEHASTIRTFQTCVFCLIFLLGVLGNCLVIATFALYRRRFLRSMTDVFLFHLALADLLLLLTMPLQAVDTRLDEGLPVSLCKVMRGCYAVNTYSGLLLLACISVDRYLVVAQAQKMLRLRSWVFACGTAAAVGVWIVALLLSLPEILFSGVAGSGTNSYCSILGSSSARLASNGAVIAAFCLSFFVMVACYSLIAHVLWEGQGSRRGKRWQRQRTLKLMVTLVLVFVLFQLPYTVVLSRKMAAHVCNLLLEYVTCTLAYARCCLNPILYALVGVRFRSDVLRLLHDCRCPCGQQVALQMASSSSPSSPPPTTVLPVEQNLENLNHQNLENQNQKNQPDHINQPDKNQKNQPDKNQKNQPDHKNQPDKNQKNQPDKNLENQPDHKNQPDKNQKNQPDHKNQPDKNLENQPDHKNQPDKNQKNQPDHKNQPDKNQKNQPDKNQKNQPDHKNQPDKNQKNQPEKNQKNQPDKNQKNQPDHKNQPDKNQTDQNHKKLTSLTRRTNE
ncbi:uncharacterized protein V6R79_022903 [Siganus canaliculatus]